MKNYFLKSNGDVMALGEKDPQGIILRYQPFILYFRKTNYLRK